MSWCIFLLLLTVEKNASTEEVAGLTVNVSDHVNAEQLQNFERSVTSSRSFKIQCRIFVKTSKLKEPVSLE